MKINGKALLSAVMLTGCMLLGCFSAAATAGGVVAISQEAETYTAVPYTQGNAHSSTNNTTTQVVKPVVSYGLRVLADKEEAVFSGMCGNEINFTAGDICRVMNLSSFSYITITELPQAGEGTLFAGAVGAREGQVISAGSISYLSFAAADDRQPCNATMKIMVDDSGYEMTCKLCLVDRLNYTPTVSLAPEISLSLETFSAMTATGTLSSYDPEGDEVTYEIVRYASHGRVTLTDRHVGAYTYTPDDGFVGQDSFTYVVRDSYGNYSTSAVVSITVSARPTAVTYADIEGHSGEADILQLSVAGVMNGVRVGAENYFKPDQTVSRVEFLVTAMHAAGIRNEDVVGVSALSFADTGDISPAMQKYVSLAVQRGYIAGKQVDGQLRFCPDENISRAEAAVILSNIIGYAHKTTVTAFADQEELPVWSVKAMTSLKALGILLPTDGHANASASITRADTAVWLNRTMKVMGKGK